MTEGIFEPEQVSNAKINLKISETEESPSGSVTEELYAEHFDRQTLESGTVSSSQEQSDDSDYWDESGIADKNTVVENSLISANSVLMGLGKLLTESEKVLIDEFYRKMENIVRAKVEMPRQGEHRNSTKVTLENIVSQKYDIKEIRGKDNPTHYRDRVITGVCDRQNIGITTVSIKVH